MRWKLMLLSWAMLVTGIACLQAQVPMTGAGVGAPGGGFTPSCTESGNFLARTSGQDTTHKTAYDNLICGLVAQNSTISGTLFSRLDGLYMLRAADSTVLLLNLVQNAFNLTSNGSITFSANAGVTGDGSTGYYSTGYNPSTAGGQLTLDSAMLALCSTTDYSASVVTIPLGSADGTNNTLFLTTTAPQFRAYVNNDGSGFASAADTTAGLWQSTRSGAATVDLYKNASNVGGTGTSSSALTNAAFNILANNSSGAPGNFADNQHVMAAWGAHYSATDVTNFRSLIQTYMTAIGGAAC